MICPGCNKFAAQNADNEPEVDLDVTGGDYEDDTEQSVNVTGTARIELCSECCGEQLKEYTFDIDNTHKITHKKHKGEHELSVEVDGSETTDETRIKKRRSKKEGGGYVEVPGYGRYATHYYGAAIQYTISCSCGAKDEFEFTDDVPSSGMDELT